MLCNRNWIHWFGAENVTPYNMWLPKFCWCLVKKAGSTWLVCCTAQACVSEKTRKLLGPGNRPAKLPKRLSCVSHFEPEKYVIFPRKLLGYSLPPEKRFRVCFSCICLIKWRPTTYFLGQNKRQRSCIKRERELRRGERSMSQGNMDFTKTNFSG